MGPSEQVTAVANSVMLASAAALEAAMPGVYINAQIDRQMQTGLVLIRSLAAAGQLRCVVVVSLGTNGSITASHVTAFLHSYGAAMSTNLE